LLHTSHRYQRIEHNHDWPHNRIVTTLFLLRLADTTGVDEPAWWALMEKRVPESLKRGLSPSGAPAERMVARQIMAAIEQLRERRLAR
jgi:hypothetical protein